MQVDVPAALTSSPMFNQVTASALAVWLLQKLKNASWFPILTKESAALNKFVAVILAAAASVGVHVSTVHQQQGVWQFTVTGLTLAGMGAALWHFIGSYAIQHGIYKGVVAPAAPNPAAVASVAADVPTAAAPPAKKLFGVDAQK